MNKTKRKIFIEAKRLFETQGYYDTTVREITNAAGVNSGLFSYYFKNKYNLARQMYDNMFQNIKSFTEEYFDHVENPAVFMGIMMRLHTYTINDDMTIKFTIDALKEGIFEESMIEKSHILITNINKYYSVGLSDDELRILLTMTLGVEHSLITQSRQGLFPMDTKSIADHVLRVHLFHFGLKDEEMVHCIAKVQSCFNKVLEKRSKIISQIMDF